MVIVPVLRFYPFYLCLKFPCHYSQICSHAIIFQQQRLGARIYSATQIVCQFIGREKTMRFGVCRNEAQTWKLKRIKFPQCFSNKSYGENKDLKCCVSPIVQKSSKDGWAINYEQSRKQIEFVDFIYSFLSLPFWIYWMRNWKIHIDRLNAKLQCDSVFFHCLRDERRLMCRLVSRCGNSIIIHDDYTLKSKIYRRR